MAPLPLCYDIPDRISSHGRPLSPIPADIYTLIFELLRPNDDLNAEIHSRATYRECILVCKYFRAYFTPLLFASISFETNSTGDDLTYRSTADLAQQIVNGQEDALCFARCFRQCTFVTRVFEDDTFDMPYEKVYTQAVRCMPNITFMRLSNSCIDKEMVHTIASLPNLTELVLAREYSLAEDVTSADLDALIALPITCFRTSHVESSLMQTTLKRCILNWPLIQLRLEAASLIDHYLSHRLESGASNLKELFLSRVSALNHFRDFLDSTPSLEKLCIRNVATPDDLHDDDLVYMRLHPKSLPNLSHVRCPIQWAHSLIPNRPLRSVDLTTMYRIESNSSSSTPSSSPSSSSSSLSASSSLWSTLLASRTPITSLRLKLRTYQTCVLMMEFPPGWFESLVLTDVWGYLGTRSQRAFAYRSLKNTGAVEHIEKASQALLTDLTGPTSLQAKYVELEAFIRDKDSLDLQLQYRIVMDAVERTFVNSTTMKIAEWIEWRREGVSALAFPTPSPTPSPTDPSTSSATSPSTDLTSTSPHPSSPPPSPTTTTVPEACMVWNPHLFQKSFVTAGQTIHSFLKRVRDQVDSKVLKDYYGPPDLVGDVLKLEGKVCPLGNSEGVNLGNSEGAPAEAQIVPSGSELQATPPTGGDIISSSSQEQVDDHNQADNQTLPNADEQPDDSKETSSPSDNATPASSSSPSPNSSSTSTESPSPITQANASETPTPTPALTSSATTPPKPIGFLRTTLPPSHPRYAYLQTRLDRVTARLAQEAQDRAIKAAQHAQLVLEIAALQTKLQHDAETLRSVPEDDVQTQLDAFDAVRRVVSVPPGVVRAFLAAVAAALQAPVVAFAKDVRSLREKLERTREAPTSAPGDEAAAERARRITEGWEVVQQLMDEFHIKLVEPEDTHPGENSSPLPVVPMLPTGRIDFEALKAAMIEAAARAAPEVVDPCTVPLPESPRLASVDLQDGQEKEPWNVPLPLSPAASPVDLEDEVDVSTGINPDEQTDLSAPVPVPAPVPSAASGSTPCEDILQDNSFASGIEETEDDSLGSSGEGDGEATPVPPPRAAPAAVRDLDSDGDMEASDCILSSHNQDVIPEGAPSLSDSTTLDVAFGDPTIPNKDQEDVNLSDKTRVRESAAFSRMSLGLLGTLQYQVGVNGGAVDAAGAAGAAVVLDGSDDVPNSDCIQDTAGSTDAGDSSACVKT